MTSAENRVSEFSNLNIFWRSITPNPPTRFLPSALEIMPPPVTKTLATALQPYLVCIFVACLCVLILAVIGHNTINKSEMSQLQRFS